MTPSAKKNALERLLAALAYLEAQPGLKTKSLSDSVARRFATHPKDLWYALKAKSRLLTICK